MISATQLRRTPPLWPTLLSLWVSGWFAGIFVVRLAPAQLVYGRLGPMLVYLSAAGALLGALVLRVILPRVAGITISYLRAVVAIGLGSLAANAFAFALQTAAFRSLPATVPTLWTSPLSILGATALSLLVSYQVIAATCRDVDGRPFARRPTPPADGLALDAPPYPSGLEGDVARAQDTVARTCVALSRGAADEIPAMVIDALTELGVCAQTLRGAAPEDPRVRAAVAQLVSGIERFETALTEIASAAAKTGSQHLYQRGLFSASVVDVSDGGALARYELDHADGLADIRAACERLRALGVLPDD
jgi:hypothetical protein